MQSFNSIKKSNNKKLHLQNFCWSFRPRHFLFWHREKIHVTIQINYGFEGVLGSRLIISSRSKVTESYSKFIVDICNYNVIYNDIIFCQLKCWLDNFGHPCAVMQGMFDLSAYFMMKYGTHYIRFSRKFCVKILENSLNYDITIYFLLKIFSF